MHRFVLNKSFLVPTLVGMMRTSKELQQFVERMFHVVKLLIHVDFVRARVEVHVIHPFKKLRPYESLGVGIRILHEVVHDVT